MRPKISIIIVNYKVKKELFDCIGSIAQSKPKVSYEIIVVDNDERKSIESKLKRRFPAVLYIKSPKNIGFGAGNNLGARYTKGEYLFFLNPDTLVFPNTVDELVNFLERHKDANVAAPLLLDKDRKPYLQQGTKNLGTLEGIVCLSFINRLFPQNPISKNYFLQEWDKRKLKEVDVVPGTAFVIRKSIFDKSGGFNEQFFLYFEEFDLCKRLKKIGSKIYILPQSKVIHFWGLSTATIKDTSSIFAQSRFLYFKKHYGVFKALLVEIFSRVNKYVVMLILVLILSLFLRLYRLDQLMAFIPDQAWFYLSARDMILTGNIPLVGPPTSHPWIHHGPLWTYVLAILLWLFNFNPIPPAYFIAILGAATVWLLYKVSSEMFTKRIGLIASFLFATSPLIVSNARIPYHTSPIPFFAIIFFYSVYKWIKGNPYYFPLITFLIAVLYNHELTTFVFSIPVILLLLYGLYKKKSWAKGIFNKKIITYSVISFLVPMIPFILYDINHGYKQTVGFLAWVVYRIIKFPLSFTPTSNFSYGFPEFGEYLKQLIFSPSLIISLLILGISIGFFSYLFIRNYSRHSGKRIRQLAESASRISYGNRRCWTSQHDEEKGTFQTRSKININLGTTLLFLYLLIPAVGLFLHRVPIEADVLLISPFLILAIAIFFNKITSFHFLKALIIIIIAVIAFANSYFVVNEYFLGEKAEKRLTISKQLEAADKIIQLSRERRYNLVGRGELSFFPVFTMPYEYLLWRKGHPPVKENVDLKIVVWEKGKEIVVYEEK